MIIKILFLNLVVAIAGLFAFASLPALAASDTNNKVFSACANVPTSAVCQDRAAQNANPTANPVNHYINVAVSIVALLTGIAAVILIIVGGIGMITSSGNPEAIANSRKRIINALVGLAIVALSWSIITFLTNHLIQT